MGCSTGGHQALTEARRYPEDYNGIVAGDPANNRVRLHMVGYWNYEATHNDPASYIPTAKLPMINRAVLDACDKIDGLADAIIDDPRKCRFDPADIQCQEADAADCLTAPQVAALKKIYQGPEEPAHRRNDLSRHVRRQRGESARPRSHAGERARFGPAASRAGPGDLDELERARPTTGTRTRRWSINELSPRARRRGSGSGGVQEARRQAAALHRLGRPADSRCRSRELLRGHAEEDGRRAGHRGVRAAVHGPGHGSLRRRHEPEPLRRARGARALGRKRDGARDDDRVADRAGRHRADAAVVRVSAGREMERHGTARTTPRISPASSPNRRTRSLGLSEKPAGRARSSRRRAR